MHEERSFVRIGWQVLKSLALVFTLLMVGITADHPQRVAAQTPAANADKVGADVLSALQAQGSARVVVALRESQTMKVMQPFDLTPLQQSVAALQQAVLSALDATDFRVKTAYKAVPAFAGTLLSEAGLNKLAAHPDVVRIDLDVGGSGGLATSVPLIGANVWQASGVRGDGVVVAVLDSGADLSHQDFAGAIIHQECFLDNDGSINGAGLCPNGSDRQSGAGAAADDAGHGTHVTGIVASRGIRSAVGVAPGAQIVAIKVTDGSSFAGAFYAFSEIVAGLDYIINNRPDVKVINMSLGTNALFSGNCDNATSFNMAGAAAINTLRNQGVIAFASAGNNGSGTQMTSPGCLSNVVSVGATNNSDAVAAFTNSNSTLDIMAPGVGIVSDAIGNGTTTASGTSMASPHAAGCAALFIQSGAATTPAQIEARLKSSSIFVTDTTNGLSFPRIQCGPRPITGMNITGPSAGLIGSAYTFTTTLSPLTATVPITYVWQTATQQFITRTSVLTHSLVLSWPVAGPQLITVTATNITSTLTSTKVITISSFALDFSGPTVGTNNTPYTFTANIQPPTTTLPITYTWQATHQSPVTHTTGISDAVTFTWPAFGQQFITVTARNNLGVVTNTHTILIGLNTYLPVIVR